MTKVISVAALITGFATASFAGALNDAIVEMPPQDDVFVAAPSSGGIAVPLAIGGALIGLALLADDDDDVVTTTGEED